MTVQEHARLNGTCVYNFSGVAQLPKRVKESKLRAAKRHVRRCSLKAPDRAPSPRSSTDIPEVKPLEGLSSTAAVKLSEQADRPGPGAALEDDFSDYAEAWLLTWYENAVETVETLERTEVEWGFENGAKASNVTWYNNWIWLYPGTSPDGWENLFAENARYERERSRGQLPVGRSQHIFFVISNPHDC